MLFSMFMQKPKNLIVSYDLIHKCVSTMQKKAVVIAVLLLLLLVPPVIAIPKTKGPKPPKIETITFTESAALGAGNIYLGNQEIIGNTLNVQDAVSTGSIIGADSPISGFEIETSLSGTLDLSTYLGSYNGRWTIDGQSGTFEGTITGNVAVTTISGKFVGHGTAGFEGQKIKGTFEGSINNFQIIITIQATITSKAS